jgi:hypothetical protein
LRFRGKQDSVGFMGPSLALSIGRVPVHSLGIGTRGMGGNRLDEHTVYADYDHDEAAVVPIPKASRRERIDENLGALRVHLGPHDRAALERAGRGRR